MLSVDREETMARMILALAAWGMAVAVVPVAAQGIYEVPPAQKAPLETAPAPLAEPVPPAPLATPVPPAPSDAPVAQASPPADKPQPEGKAPEGLPVDSAPPDGAAAEAKPAENAHGRFTFSRVNDEYVRLDNRTGQVSVCSKRTVGWTCQLAPEDRGVLENEIVRLQEENALLKKELLVHGMPLPGSMKAEPPAARNERTFSLPSDPNIDRMKEMVEKAWRRLVDMISALQKDVLKKS
jgi:hypothetical protein